MGVSFQELRRVCQLPVRERNDVAGLLFGDHASLPITKFFVDLRLSPNYASIGFLIAGLVGAALQSFACVWALAGALLLVLYYVLDCVDGEVARFQRVVDVRWGYYDYLFHMLIKPLTFFGVALGSFLELDLAWVFCAAFSAAVATLWLKMFLEIPGILFLKDVLKRSRRTGGAHRGALPVAVSAREPEEPERTQRFQLRFDRVTLRALMTNFDVGLLLLVVATALDLSVPPPSLPGAGTLSFRALWLTYYGVVLPLDFIDYLHTYLRRGHFSQEMTRLLALAHHFRSELPEPEVSAER